MRLLLIVLTSPLWAADVPYYLRDVKTQKDVSAINENFRAASDATATAQRGVDAIVLSTGMAFLASTQTFTGANTFSAAVILSSTVATDGQIHNSSVTVIANTTFSGTTFISCFASTVTITTNGAHPAAVFFSGFIANDTTNSGCLLTVRIDGVAPTGMTAAQAITQVVAGAATTGGNASFYYVTQSLSAGSHSFCLNGRASAGTCTLNNSASFSNQFGVVELK